MLKKANKLKSNDPFIIDSLGWALFKLKKYKESKDYLQLAVRLLPADPIVNDHFGDVLWKNGKKIQARYYWNYVYNLEKTEDKLKKTIEKKLIEGLNMVLKSYAKINLSLSVNKKLQGFYDIQSIFCRVDFLIHFNKRN